MNLKYLLVRDCREGVGNSLAFGEKLSRDSGSQILGKTKKGEDSEEKFCGLRLLHA